MKKKKFKKLALSSETLRHLSDSEAENVVGAVTAGVTVAGTKCTVRCSVCTHACSVCLPCA